MQIGLSNDVLESLGAVRFSSVMGRVAEDACILGAMDGEFRIPSVDQIPGFCKVFSWNETLGLSMSTVDSFVGRRIRVFRLTGGVSQDELAKHLQITVPQLDTFEDGLARITAIQLFQIAERLNVPITAFFEGIDAHGDWHSQPSAAHHYTRQSLMLEHFSALSDDKQDAILKMTRAMAQSDLTTRSKGRASLAADLRFDQTTGG